MRPRSKRCDCFGIDTRMAFRVVLLDVLEIGGIFEGWDAPIQPLEPVVDLRVVVPDGP